MDLLITLISLEIIASKFLAVFIATYRMNPEKLSFTAKLLEKAGIENDIWISFFCTVALVGASLFLLSTYYAAIPFQVLYIFTGVFTTTLNLGAAHSNYFGRKNFITEKLLKYK